MGCFLYLHLCPSSSLQEVAAARSIAQRGVLLIGTAHGNSLADVLRNPVSDQAAGGGSE